jgi:trans-2-enoyl-CoA reductase
MKETINVVVYEKHGNPADVLRLDRQPWPKAQRGEAVVEMRAAPINPADLNAIEGKYPGRREVPAIPGFEGAGVIVDLAAASPSAGGLGPDAKSLSPGDLVILPHTIGTWRDAVAVKTDELVVVPAGINPVHAATLKINPLTAWRLLHGYVELKSGDWLIQNAANSAAGRAVIEIAHERGYKTVNVVRRAELIDELRTQGGDVVLVDGENLRDEVKAVTNSAPIRLALNAVGGESALRLANCLAPGSTMVTFGAMSLQPLKIPTGLLIFKDLRFRGIWINKWYDHATQAERMAAFGPLFAMAKRGLLQTKIEKSYPLNEFKTAVAHAARGNRSGKIIFEFGG